MCFSTHKKSLAPKQTKEHYYFVAEWSRSVDLFMPLQLSDQFHIADTNM